MKRLGKGGNATVWEARREDVDDVDDIVALKVLDTLKPASEPYKRFRDEVRILQALAGEPGVLPVLDHHLPDRPSPADRAWLAMPIATPIGEALHRPRHLEDVVAAAAQIAGTLVRLAERGISHRDIKSGNLYRYGGAFVIGDFGLVTYPEKEPITTDQRWLGPLHFMAPEMISNPESADGGAADVFSLAKTFWVLATDQNWPPQGHQTLDAPATCIASLVSHPRVRQLDWLVERATAHVPSERITMRKLESELRAWLRPDEARATVPDLASIGERYQAQVADRDRRETRRLRWEEESRRLLTTWAESLGPIAADLVANRFRVTFRLADNNPTISEMGPAAARLTAPTLALREGRCVLLAPPDDPNLLLWIGVGVCLVKDGTLILTAGTRLRTAGDRHEVLWVDERETHIESSEVRHHLAELRNSLAAALPAALQRYTDAVEAARAAEDPLAPLDLPRTVSSIVVWLNEGSEHAVDGFESISPVEVLTHFSLTEEQLVDAIREIEARRWVDVSRAWSGAEISDIVSLSPTPLLFIDTDPFLQGWDPKRDADHIATIALEGGEHQVALRDLADRLGWDPRRVNPAIYMLVQADAVEVSPPSTGAYPFAYDDFVVTAHTRRFLMR